MKRVLKFRKVRDLCATFACDSRYILFLPFQQAMCDNNFIVWLPLLLTCGLPLGRTSNELQRPHIIFILADDLVSSSNFFRMQMHYTTAKSGLAKFSLFVFLCIWSR